MSYYPATPIPAPAARPRPTTVRVASVLMYITAGLFVIDGIVSIANQSTTVSGSGSDSAENAAFVIGFAVGLGGPILLAAGLAILAYFVDRGRNGARITTWVAAGILTLCCGCGSLSGIIGQTSAFDSLYANQPGGNPFNEVSTSQLAATAVFEGLSALALLIVIILLALPDSNDYFRRPPAVVMWPGSGPQWPGYPPSQQPWSAQAPGPATWPTPPTAPGTPTPGTPEMPTAPGWPPAPPYANPDPGAWQRPPVEIPPPPAEPQPPTDPTSPPR
jgi:hypothetical protein